MTDQELLERIATSPQVLGGRPVIAGTRLSVEHILNLLAHGASRDEIMLEYPGVTVDDISACLLFAARSMENTAFMPLGSE